jgi:hypothetical protein
MGDVEPAHDNDSDALIDPHTTTGCTVYATTVRDKCDSGVTHLPGPSCPPGSAASLETAGQALHPETLHEPEKVTHRETGTRVPMRRLTERLAHFSVRGEPPVSGVVRTVGRCQ